MQKELLTVEFRYLDVPKGDYDSCHKSKTITIGVYDTLEEAIEAGNKVLNILSKKFEVRFDDQFKLKHLFGTPQRLVSNCCYPTKRIQYFAKIEALKFDDLEETINHTFEAAAKYKAYKIKEEQD